MTSIGQYLTANPVGLIEFIAGIKLSDAVQYGRSFNQMLMIDKVERGEIMRVITGMILKAINSVYTLPQPVNQAAATAMAGRLIQYPELGIEDAMLILQKGMYGEFGQTYNKFDLDTWSAWIDQYLDQRIDEVERQYKQTKETAGTPNRDTRVLEMTDKMIYKDNRPPDERMFEKSKILTKNN